MYISFSILPIRSLIFVPYYWFVPFVNFLFFLYHSLSSLIFSIRFSSFFFLTCAFSFIFLFVLSRTFVRVNLLLFDFCIRIFRFYCISSVISHSYNFHLVFLVCLLCFLLYHQDGYYSLLLLLIMLFSFVLSRSCFSIVLSRSDISHPFFFMSYVMFNLLCYFSLSLFLVNFSCC